MVVKEFYYCSIEKNKDMVFTTMKLSHLAIKWKLHVLANCANTSDLEIKLILSMCHSLFLVFIELALLETGREGIGLYLCNLYIANKSLYYYHLNYKILNTIWFFTMFLVTFKVMKGLVKALELCFPNCIDRQLIA